MDERKRLVKNAGLFAIGNFSIRLVSFILLPLYTSILSTGDYGVADYIISISFFCIPIITVLMEESMFRFLIDCRNEKEKKTIISTALAIVLFGSIIFLFGSTIFFSYISYEYSIFLILLVFSDVIISMMSATLRGIGRTDLYVLYNFITSIFTIMFNVLFLVVLKWGVEGLLISNFLPKYLITIIYIFAIKLWKYIDIKYVDEKSAKVMIKYSLPLIPNKVSWNIIDLSDRIILMDMLGSSSVGLYAMANKFPTLMNTFYGFFYMSWKESSARALQTDNSNDFYNEIYNYLKSLMFSLVLGLTAFMPLIFRLLINEKFSEAILYVPILLFGMYFANMSGFFGGIFTAYKDTNSMGKSAIMSAIINIIINIVFIPQIGIYAAAISTLVANYITYLYRKHKVKKYIILEKTRGQRITSMIVAIIIICCFYSNSVILLVIGGIISFIYAALVNKIFLSNLIKFISNKFCK